MQGEQQKTQRKRGTYKDITIDDINSMLASSDPIAKLGEMLNERRLPKKFVENTMKIFQQGLDITKQRTETERDT